MLSNHASHLQQIHQNKTFCWMYVLAVNLSVLTQIYLKLKIELLTKKNKMFINFCDKSQDEPYLIANFYMYNSKFIVNVLASLLVQPQFSSNVLYRYFWKILTKGQLILKNIFGVFNFLQKVNENKST